MTRILPIGFVLICGGAALADDVYLKDAGSITGKIIEQNDQFVKVDIGDGFMAVPMSHVDRIVKGRSPLDEYADRAAKLGPQDADGWRALGKYAANEGFPAQSKQAYEKVIAIAPNDAAARKALGFVSLNGQWVTLEESYRAQGYVKHDGEWMTPAEAQAQQQDFAADQARRDAEHRANSAENSAVQAEARAEKAEERAAQAERQAQQNNPVYWGGGWGPGVPASAWPTFGGGIFGDVNDDH